VKVLVAEDDVVFRRILESMLGKWDYDVVTASDGIEAWEILQAADAPQLALLDWMMPGLDGTEICRRVRQGPAEPYIYIILLTARGQRGDMIAGLDAGADDYITKPFDPMELKGRVRAGIRILNLQSDLVAAREALRYQATHDPLTHISNRSAILQVLKGELFRATRQDTHVAVALADIDKFKRINDTYGHTAGDIVLCEIARTMGETVRTYDSLGRYGGEEFLIVLPGCDRYNASGMADRLRVNVFEHPVGFAGVSISVSISMGVATTDIARCFDIDDLIRIADAALYRAKAAGRNCVVLADEAELQCIH
jgi:two-component system cell cycle response regulator